MNDKWTSAAEWAGGYDRTFAKVALRRVLLWLRAHVSMVAAPVCSFPAQEDGEEPQVDEQSFEDPEAYDYDPQAQDADSDESWSAN